MLEARLLGFAVSLILIGLPAELEPGVAAEPGAARDAIVAVAVDQGGQPAGPLAHRAALETRSSVEAKSGNSVQRARIGAYDDRTLQAFAVTAYRMIAIRDRWRPVVEQAAAAGPEEVAKARRAEALELAQAIRAQGLSNATYRRIFNTAQKDPAFKSYLLTLVRSVDTNSATD